MLRILILRIYENKYIHHFGKLKFYFYSESTHLHKIQCVLRHATVSILQTLINFFCKNKYFFKRKKIQISEANLYFFFLIQRPTLYETFSGNGSGYLPVRVLQNRVGIHKSSLGKFVRFFLLFHAFTRQLFIEKI